MKTYVLTVSRVFPCIHKRKGEETGFGQKLQNGILKQSLIGNSALIPIIPIPDDSFKIHTIRANYELWAKRLKEVQEGKAILSIRYWSGKPYNSKQVEVCQLNKDSGCGVQDIRFAYWDLNKPWILYDESQSEILNISDIAKNDGLSLDDFKEWFRKYDLSKPMAIIHFTSFRY